MDPGRFAFFLVTAMFCLSVLMHAIIIALIGTIRYGLHVNTLHFLGRIWRIAAGTTSVLLLGSAIENMGLLCGGSLAIYLMTRRTNGIALNWNGILPGLGAMTFWFWCLAALCESSLTPMI